MRLGAQIALEYSQEESRQTSTSHSCYFQYQKSRRHVSQIRTQNVFDLRMEVGFPYLVKRCNHVFLIKHATYLLLPLLVRSTTQSPQSLLPKSQYFRPYCQKLFGRESFQSDMCILVEQSEGWGEVPFICNIFFFEEMCKKLANICFFG